jgi:hypothetical protein
MYRQIVALPSVTAETNNSDVNRETFMEYIYRFMFMQNGVYLSMRILIGINMVCVMFHSSKML